MRTCRRFPFYLFLCLCSAVVIVKMMKQHCKTVLKTITLVCLSQYECNKCWKISNRVCVWVLGLQSDSVPSFSLLLSLFVAAAGLLMYVVVLILLVILIWGPAHSHIYSCPAGGLPITISQRLSGSTRGGASTHQEGVL